MADVSLTGGFLHNIVNSQDSQEFTLPINPIVQVVGVKRFSRDGDPERYRVAISDGVHYYSSAMLTTQCSNLVKTNVILKAIVQLVHYSCPFRLQGRKVIVIRELKILKMARDVPGMIGHPTPLSDQSNPVSTVTTSPGALTAMWDHNVSTVTTSPGVLTTMWDHNVSTATTSPGVLTTMWDHNVSTVTPSAGALTTMWDHNASTVTTSHGVLTTMWDHNVSTATTSPVALTTMWDHNVSTITTSPGVLTTVWDVPLASAGGISATAVGTSAIATPVIASSAVELAADHAPAVPITAPSTTPVTSVIVCSSVTSSVTPVSPDIVSGSAILATLAASCTTPASSVIPSDVSDSDSNNSPVASASSLPSVSPTAGSSSSRKRGQCSTIGIDDEDESARKKTAAVSGLCRCSVCFEIFSDPKSLNCEHHFCKECLEELVQFDHGVPIIKCPLCLIEHRFRNSFETVSSLKCQLFLKQVLETFKGDTEPGDILIPRCCDKQASWFCGDCTKYLCEDCTLGSGSVKRHGDCGAFCVYIRYHPGKSTMMPFCLQHNSFVYYGCMTCQTVVCPYCKQSSHRAHDVRSFNEYADQVKSNLSQLIEDTKVYNNQVEELLQKSTQEDVSSCIAGKAKTIRERCTSFIDSVEKKLIEEAVRSQEKEVNMWKSQLRKNEDFLAEGQSLLTKERTDLVCSRDKVLKQIPGSSVATEGVEIDASVESKGFEDIFKGICGVFGGMRVPHMDAKGNIINTRVPACWCAANLT